MSLSLIHDPASEALLSAARDHSPSEEQKCHVLLELMDTCQSLGQTFRRELARNNLTDNGFRILALAVHCEPAAVTPSEVSAALCLPRLAVTSILGRLEISGLITRERISEHRRILAIRITTSGRQVFSTALCHYRELVTRCMSSLDTETLTALDQACTRLRQLSH